MCGLGSSSWWGRRDRVHSVRSSDRGHHVSMDRKHRRNSASQLTSRFLLFIQSRTPIHRMVPTTLSTDLTLNLSGNFLKHPLGNGDPWRLERCRQGSEHLLLFQRTGFQLLVCTSDPPVLGVTHPLRASVGACTHTHVTPTQNTDTSYMHT